jgi:ankyrin repeat protein
MDLLNKLSKACVSNNLDLVKYLVEHGVNVNARDKYGDTALVVASGEAGRLNIVKYLVENGADVNFKADDNWTPLFAARYYENAHIVEYLVEHGAVDTCF